MSRIFVSGQINDFETVREVQEALKAAGHTITHDWTTNETGAQMLGSRESKLANIKEATRRATNDIRGVLSADVYVICTNNQDAGKGMYVELGAAIAVAESSVDFKVYLLGDMNHMTIFYFHPKVQRVESMEALLEDLEVRA